MINRKRLTIVVAFLMTMVLLAGMVAWGQDEHKYGGTLYFRAGQEPPGLIPPLTGNWTDLYVYGFCSETLAWGGLGFPAELRPVLAKSWDVSEDGKVWTLHLREGVKWHDGVPFTADDVVFWAEAQMDPAFGAAYGIDLFYVNGEPLKFEKIDDLTVRVTAVAPVRNLLAQIAIPLIPKHPFEGWALEDIVNHPMNQTGCLGTGPFIPEYRPDEGVIILTAFEDYWGGRPYLDRIVMRIIPDDEAGLAALQTGEIDWSYVWTSQMDIVKQLEGISYWIQESGDSARIMAINSSKPMLADERTRQAIMYALDRETMLDNIQQGYGQVMASPWFGDMCSAYEPLTPYEYNPTKASELLAAVGWVPGGDGILVAQNVEGVEPGTRFSIEYHTRSTNDAYAIFAQQYLGAVGIEVTQVTMDRATYSALNNPGVTPKAFDLRVAGYGSKGVDAASYTQLYGTSALNSSWDFEDPICQAVFAYASGLLTQEEADVYYKAIAEYIWEKVPAAFLWTRVWIYAWNEKVHVDEAVLNAQMFTVFENPAKIWIED